jgi:hypothetical protein
MSEEVKHDFDQWSRVPRGQFEKTDLVKILHSASSMLF